MPSPLRRLLSLRGPDESGFLDCGGPCCIGGLPRLSLSAGLRRWLLLALELVDAAGDGARRSGGGSRDRLMPRPFIGWSMGIGGFMSRSGGPPG